MPHFEAGARKRQKAAVTKTRSTYEKAFNEFQNTPKEALEILKSSGITDDQIIENIHNKNKRDDSIKENRRLYFIRSENSVKAGISVAPDERLKTLAVARPDVALLGHIPWKSGMELLKGIMV
ncbi:MAG: hypothetical protein PHY16_16505 [Methylobacter sp.]|nr:hypothetical protein [Methylobacter sp.]